MIGVFGGSFDPIHFGHIDPLMELSEQFEFSSIRLITTYKSPVSKIFHSDASHRHNMVSIIAASTTNNFIADDVEIRKKDVSYTYKTIQNLKNTLKNEDICVIIGLDVFLHIETWYNYEKIIEEVNIIVVNRPDFNIKSTENMGFSILSKITKDKTRFLESKKGCIFFYEMPSIGISSTRIRNMIGRGENSSGMIPGSIMSYIKRNKLYMEKI